MYYRGLLQDTGVHLTEQSVQTSVESQGTDVLRPDIHRSLPGAAVVLATGAWARALDTGHPLPIKVRINTCDGKDAQNPS